MFNGLTFLSSLSFCTLRPLSSEQWLFEWRTC